MTPRRPTGYARAFWLIFAAVTLLRAPAVCAADFYAGKTVTIIVGTDESGGFSLYARLIGAWLGRHVPGAPTVIVRNMPGAGGSTAAAYMATQAPRDGTMIASLTPNAIMDRLFGRKSQVDPMRFGFVGGAERSVRLCLVSARSGVVTLQEAMSHKLIIGATQSGSPTTDYANFIKRATDAKFEIVNGYAGPGNIYLAMERGEIDGVCGVDWTALKAQKPDALRDKSIRVLVQFNEKSDPELDALGVSQPWPFIRDRLDREAIRLMVNFQQAFGKGYVAPPQTPTDRLALLREGFAAALEDASFRAEAEKARLDVAVVPGGEVEATVRELYTAPPDVVERLKALTSDEMAK